MNCFYSELSLSLPCCLFKHLLHHRVKGGKKGRPRKSQTSEDGSINENETTGSEGDQAYMLNDGSTSSPSVDGSGPAPFSVSNNDPTAEISHQFLNAEGGGGMINSTGSTGDVSDHMNATGDAPPAETAGFVPDGSLPGKIKKPRRLEELAFQFMHEDT